VAREPSRLSALCGLPEAFSPLAVSVKCTGPHWDVLHPVPLLSEVAVPDDASGNRYDFDAVLNPGEHALLWRSGMAKAGSTNSLPIMAELLIELLSS
jgi:hypothetical protein